MPRHWSIFLGVWGPPRQTWRNSACLNGLGVLSNVLPAYTTHDSMIVMPGRHLRVQIALPTTDEGD